MRKLAWVFLLVSSAVFAQQSGPALLEHIGYPRNAKLLIIHADDIGMSHSVNVASFEALEKDWVSSGSVMVPCPWFNEAAEFARQHPWMDLGLHLTLTSEWRNYRWGPAAKNSVSSLLDVEGYFPRDSGSVGKNAGPAEAAGEIAAQVAKAKSTGIRFTHIDNHMGALSQSPALFKSYMELSRSASVPASFSQGEVKGYGGIVSLRDVPMPIGIGPADNKELLEGYRETFARLGPGVYIMVVHLGHDDEELRAIMGTDAGGASGRQRDYDLVSNPRFQRMLGENGIKLIGWKDLAGVK